MTRNRKNRRAGSENQNQRGVFLLVAVALVVILGVCAASFSGGWWLLNTVTGGDSADSDASPSWSTDSAELTIAASTVMAPVLNDLATRFNSLDLRTSDDRKMAVWVMALSPDEIVEQSLDIPSFQAISPDSSLWLDQLEQQWAALDTNATTDSPLPIGQRRIGEQLRYAVSPIVIAAWEQVARDLGWPETPVNWAAIQRKATEDPSFKWNHPSTNNAAGLLATLAEFYAGAGLTRGLTEDAATAQSTLDYVQAVESTIRFYGEGEEVIVQRLAEEGRNFLDAFVAQERVVVDWNQRNAGERLVALYPGEGTLWTDHPLALLELGTRPHELAVTNNQRQTFRAFADFLLSPESQNRLLAEGYRPADLSIPLDQSGSPFAGTDAVDWRQPQTTLQIPPPSVVEVVRNVWYYTKRPTNVYLVVDSSGSMEGTKIVRAREALAAFVNQIQGDRDKIGLVEFASGTKTQLALNELDAGTRGRLLDTIENMEAYGGTALVDAVYTAVRDIQAQGDPTSINAIVVMTDGQENESRYRLSDVERLLATSSNSPVIFTIAFGNDADEGLLRSLAEIGQGQFRRADETDIEELYRIISTYF